MRFIPAISDNLLDRQRDTIKYDYAHERAIASHARGETVGKFYPGGRTLTTAMARRVNLMIHNGHSIMYNTFGPTRDITF